MSKPEEANLFQREVIVEVGIELGSITLYGWRQGDRWRYSAGTVDQTPMLLEDEFDEPEIRKESGVFESWEAALRHLNRYPLHRFYPLTVHPEFRDRVWAAVQARFAADREHHEDGHSKRWREICE
jgi:hypothetical protein